MYPTMHRGIHPQSLKTNVVGFAKVAAKVSTLTRAGFLAEAEKLDGG